MRSVTPAAPLRIPTAVAATMKDRLERYDPVPDITIPGHWLGVSSPTINASAGTPIATPGHAAIQAPSANASERIGTKRLVCRKRTNHPDPILPIWPSPSSGLAGLGDASGRAC